MGETIAAALTASSVVHRQTLAIAFVAVITAGACGGGDKKPAENPTGPTSTNRSPQITAISVSPAFGVAGLTLFTMNATAIDPDGDPVTYKWTFGGQAVNAASVTTTLTGE